MPAGKHLAQQVQDPWRGWVTWLVVGRHGVKVLNVVVEISIILALEGEPEWNGRILVFSSETGEFGQLFSVGTVKKLAISEIKSISDGSRVKAGGTGLSGSS